MTDRPIIFSAPMVRALLDGRKTQTRRVLGKTSGRVNIFNAEIAWADSYVMDPGNAEWRARYTPYAPGDRLYVREAIDKASDRDGVFYRADYEAQHGDATGLGWRPSIHMPRWASRLTLTVTEVRVQRLQEISAGDSIAEGVECETCTAMGQSACHGRGCFASIDAYRTLWNSLHGPDAWDANPWVVALTFNVKRGNIDQIGGAK
jgi:hypothetical protein